MNKRPKSVKWGPRWDGKGYLQFYDDLPEVLGARLKPRAQLALLLMMNRLCRGSTTVKYSLSELSRRLNLTRQGASLVVKNLTDSTWVKIVTRGSNVTHEATEFDLSGVLQLGQKSE